MARIDRGKRALGGAIKRSTPSRAATILVERGLVTGRALDYGCGYALDAATFGWDAYDPYYRPAKPAGPYDTIVCTLVLNALSRNNRTKVLARIQALLAQAKAGTHSYPPEAVLPAEFRGAHATTISVTNESTLVAAHRLAAQSHRVAALNFASARHPGGGWLSGARAQEESLACASGLVACIADDPMYARHERMRDALYTSGYHRE
jgi:hypothetical protein